MPDYDIAIIGLGAMGSAAAFHLSGTSQRVLAVDQFRPPHRHGSTHGGYRVTRQAIGEGAVYTPIVLRSNEIWRELERLTGDSLLHLCGGLIFGNPHSGHSAHQTEAFLSRTLDCAKLHGIAHEVLDQEELRHRFPQFEFADGDIGYFEPGAGYLDPERCVEVQLQLAEANGVECRFHLRLDRMEPTRHGIELLFGEEKVTAGRVIVSCGPWMESWLPASLGGQLKTYRQTKAWFEPGPVSTVGGPIFIRLPADGRELVYGFPQTDDLGVQIAAEEFDLRRAPDGVASEVEAEDVARLHHKAQSAVSLGENCRQATQCYYTMTPDGDFLIDSHPESERIRIASPCSGHGFKHSAAIGEALADWAIDREPRLDLDTFSAARFLREAD